MKPIIIRPQSEILRRYVQYFLFFNRESNTATTYTTFPNNNLCLSLYKNQSVEYLNTASANICNIRSGVYVYTSRFYGFHSMPFTVNIEGSLDQICIILRPAALRAFTNEGYKDLLESVCAFSDVFGHSDIQEQIFDSANFFERSDLLERYLLKKLMPGTPDKLKEILHLTATGVPGALTIRDLSKRAGISEATLYRLFLDYLGQGPKAYLKTIRFRKVLTPLIHNGHAMDRTHYLSGFYDQAHFIKDFRTFSGYTPKALAKLVSLEGNELAWVCNQSGNE